MHGVVPVHILLFCFTYSAAQVAGTKIPSRFVFLSYITHNSGLVYSTCDLGTAVAAEPAMPSLIIMPRIQQLARKKASDDSHRPGK